MGRKKRRNRSADADVVAASPGGGAAAGKRSLTEGLPPASSPASAASSVPAMLARPEAADAAYEVHKPPPVGLATWFDDVFGDEGKSPWSWSADGAEYEKEKEAGGDKSKVKLFFDADEKKVGASSSKEGNDGKTSMSADLMKGKVKWKQTGADGNGTSFTGNLGGGELGGELGTVKETKSGETTTKEEQKAKISMVANEDDGVGMMGGATNKKVVDDGATKKEKELVLRGGVTDKGALADGSYKQKWKGKDGWETQGKVSADGAFLVEVIPPKPGEDPTRFRIVTTLRAGIDLKGHHAKSLVNEKEGADDAESGDNKVKLAGGIDAGGSLVYSRLMSEAEAKAYLAELDSDKPTRSTAFPEFAVLDKLRTVVTGDGNETAAAASLVGSAGSARALKPGDSVSLSLHGGFEGEFSADVQGRGIGAGLELGGSLEYVRDVTISGLTGGKVKVHIGFERESSTNAGASATVMNSKLAGGTAHAASDGEAREYVLDPRLEDYDACYAKILAVWSRDGLHALDQDPKVLAHRTKAITEAADSDTANGGVSLLSIGPKGDTSKFGSKSIEVDKEGASGGFSGGQKANLGLGAGGASPLQRNRTDTATASVDGDGRLSAELETKSARTDFLDTIVNAPRIAAKWLGFDEEKHEDPTAGDVMTGLLAKTPGERIVQLLSTTYTRLSGYHLSASDVDTVVARAADEPTWMHCARRPGAVIPMRILRAHLLSEAPDPEVAFDADDAQQRERAVKLAQARAIADFMRNAGSAGMEAMTYVVRRWGENATRENDGSALGVRYDWPESLAQHHKRYDAVTEEIRGVEATYAAIAGKPNARAAADKLHGRIRTELYTIREAVSSSTDIHSERARAEMLDEMARYETVEVTAYREAGAQIDTAAGADGASANGTTAGPALDDPATLPMPGRIAPVRIRTLTRELAAMKSREATMLTRVNGLVAAGKKAAALDELHELRELYDFWHERSQELHDAYAWVHESNRPGPEPSVEHMIRLWLEAGGDTSVNDWPAVWRQRWKK